MTTLASILLIIIPMVILRRFIKSGHYAFFNFCLFPLVFSYLYLLIPTLINSRMSIIDILGVNNNSLREINALSIWYVIVFLSSYILTTDPRFKLNNNLQISNITINASKIQILIAATVCSYALIIHGPTLFGLSNSRTESYQFYSENILGAYAIKNLLTISLVSAFILTINNRNSVYFLFVTPFIILDTLQGGRGLTFPAILCFTWAHLLVHPSSGKKITYLLLISTFTLYASTYFRRSSGSAIDFEEMLIEYFGEFYYTRLTAEYVYTHKLDSDSLINYAIFCTSKLIPQFMIEPFASTEFRTRYDVLINAETGVGFGLAGSILSEALYHGGVIFAWLSPIIIASFNYLCQRSKMIINLSGFIFFLLIASSSYAIFRSAFYSTVTSLIYFFFIYLSFQVMPSLRKRLLTTIR